VSKYIGSSAVTPAEEYREHAAICLRAAQLAVIAEVEATLIDMAQQWNQLAECMHQLAVAEALRCRLESDAKARNRVQ
jgi:hypothetical protein